MPFGTKWEMLFFLKVLLQMLTSNLFFIFKEAVVSKNQKFFVLKSRHEISHICRVTFLNTIHSYNKRVM